MSRIVREGETGPGDLEIARFLRGDPRLVADLRDHAARIVHFKGYYIPDSEQQDIVQEVMAQLWQAVAVRDVKLTGTLRSLTEAIACRRCVDWVRRRRVIVPMNPEMMDRSQRPDELLLERERTARARSVLARLRTPCRDLIRLLLYEGRRYADIALEQGRSEHALRTKMYQCLKDAREMLRQMETEPGRTGGLEDGA